MHSQWQLRWFCHAKSYSHLLWHHFFYPTWSVGNLHTEYNHCHYTDLVSLVNIPGRVSWLNWCFNFGPHAIKAGKNYLLKMWSGMCHISKLYRMKAMKPSQWFTKLTSFGLTSHFNSDIILTSHIVCPAYMPQPVDLLDILQVHGAFSLFRKLSDWFFAWHLIIQMSTVYCPTFLKFYLEWHFFNECLSPLYLQLQKMHLTF